MNNIPIIEVRDIMLRPLGIWSMEQLNQVGIYLEDICWDEPVNGYMLKPTNNFVVWLDQIESSYYNNDGMPQIAIAEHLGIAAQSVARRLERAFIKMRMAKTHGTIKH